MPWWARTHVQQQGARARFDWPIVLITLATLALYDAWWLRMNKRHWVAATVAGVKSWHLENVEAERAVAASYEAGAAVQASLRAGLYGDICGALFGGLLFLVH